MAMRIAEHARSEWIGFWRGGVCVQRHWDVEAETIESSATTKKGQVSDTCFRVLLIGREIYVF
jgi:hypothetical protein